VGAIYARWHENLTELNRHGLGQCHHVTARVVIGETCMAFKEPDQIGDWTAPS
jgi:hypothetical protein